MGPISPICTTTSKNCFYSIIRDLFVERILKETLSGVGTRRHIHKKFYGCTNAKERDPLHLSNSTLLQWLLQGAGGTPCHWLLKAILLPNHFMHSSPHLLRACLQNRLHVRPRAAHWPLFTPKDSILIIFGAVSGRRKPEAKFTLQLSNSTL